MPSSQPTPMFLSRHPELDATRLAERVRHVVQQQYQSQSLIAQASVTPEAPDPTQPPAPTRVWRQRLKLVPGLQPAAAWWVGRWHRLRSPQSSASERFRAVPVLGDLFAWGLALSTVLRWRSQLRQQQAQTLLELAELRRQQANSQRELAQLRQQLREALRRLDSGPPRSP